MSEKQEQPAAAQDSNVDGAADQQEKAPQKKGPPGGFDASKVPHAPPGYTVRIAFHRATALPIADLSTLSSDPYIHAELRTALQTRHKEDPPLAFRSHTVWRSTNPEWNEDWILHHVPSSGFRMKIRIYDEDSNDTDDRLGNVHVNITSIGDNFQPINDRPYEIKKRSGSKRAYFVRALAVCFGRAKHMSGNMWLSVEVLGRSPGEDGGRAYTFGRNYWCKHYSPLLGRIAGRKEPDRAESGAQTTQDESAGTGQQNPSELPNATAGGSAGSTAPNIDPSEVRRVGAKAYHGQDQTTAEEAEGHKAGPEGVLDAALKREQQHKARKEAKVSGQRYNFQANQMQLQGPTPPELYHRYVEFRPIMKSLFTKTGIRGTILAKALHHQHNAVYNFNRDTHYGVYDEPCREMTLKFLDLCHWDEGGRIFTYVLTLDSLMRFTETGKEFGIDLLSKHTMHSDASIYIAFSGEFFIRRLRKPYNPEHDGASQADSRPIAEHSPEQSHPPAVFEGGPPTNDAPQDPAYYELIIDNDSGTYRPNAKLLPQLRHFLMKSLPGLKIATLDSQNDSDLMNRLKGQQRERKEREQGQGHMVYTQVSSRSGSISSDDEDRLDQLAGNRDGDQQAESGASEPAQTHKLGEAVAPLVGNHPHVRHAFGEKPGAVSSS